jgi:hypothetical protein
MAAPTRTGKAVKPMQSPLAGGAQTRFFGKLHG